MNATQNPQENGDQSSAPKVNPFNGVGKPVIGKRFIGRREMLTRLRRAIVSPECGRSIRIHGIARIGKTSLVQQVLRYNVDEIRQSRVLPVYIAMGRFEAPAAFYRAIVKETVKQLKEWDSLTDRVKQCADEVASSENDLVEDVGNFYNEVRRAEWRTVLAIDEFDFAPKVFPSAAGFQVLRELPNDPNFSTDLIVISRRPLRSIERRIDSTSNLHGLLYAEPMTVFEDAEVRLLVNQLAEVDLDVTSELLDNLHQMCGNHPFLLSTICCAIADEWLDGDTYDLKKLTGWRGIGVPFTDYYEDLLLWLNDIGMQNKLLEILFGPQVTAQEADADELLHYGVLRLLKDKHFGAFSEHWHEYLRLLENATPLWPLWTEAERAVRGLIDRTMVQEFGSENWYDPFVLKHSKYADVFQKCKDRCETERNRFGGQASNDLLEYLNWSEIWPLLKAYWPRYEMILGPQKHWSSHWDDTMGAVRNPMCHGRPVPDVTVRRLTEALCKDLRDRINKAEIPDS